MGGRPGSARVPVGTRPAQAGLFLVRRPTLAHPKISRLPPLLQKPARFPQKPARRSVRAAAAANRRLRRTPSLPHARPPQISRLLPHLQKPARFPQKPHAALYARRQPRTAACGERPRHRTLAHPKFRGFCRSYNNRRGSHKNRTPPCRRGGSREPLPATKALATARSPTPNFAASAAPTKTGAVPTKTARRPVGAAAAANRCLRRRPSPPHARPPQISRLLPLLQKPARFPQKPHAAL
jgi:hypothetical protein